MNQAARPGARATAKVILFDDDDPEATQRGGQTIERRLQITFVGGGLERLFIMATAVTALGTRLFSRFGEGKGKEKKEINRVKKDADAISAYMLSECLWHITRQLPENHAVMVCLGEGLMPKGGETPDMGSNPLLGFGRIYARPQVAKMLDRQVQKLINNPDFGWEDFQRRIDQAGVTVWGAAVDTLENTSRFAKGAPTGPMTVFHLFDQPLNVTRPYEGYMGNLILPRVVRETAARDSLLVEIRRLGIRAGGHDEHAVEAAPHADVGRVVGVIPVRADLVGGREVDLLCVRPGGRRADLEDFRGRRVGAGHRHDGQWDLRP